MVVDFPSFYSQEFNLIVIRTLSLHHGVFYEYLNNVLCGGSALIVLKLT